MTKEILRHFPQYHNRYVEVFGGSASLLFAKVPEPLEVYNDLEEGVYSLFKCLSSNELFIQLKTLLDLTPYHARIREESKQKGNTIIEKAYNFFILNRMSFNGVGGFSRNFIVRRKMSKSVSDFLASIERLDAIHQRLSGVLIENNGWEKILDRYDAKDTLFYLDPPYVKATRLSNQSYKQDMTEEEHKGLVTRINTLKAKVILSGYDSPIYDALIGFSKYSFPSPNSKSKAIEVLWKNY